MKPIEMRGPSRAAEVIERYGTCLELIPIDSHFENISVGLYFRDDTFTVWTFSRRKGVERRIERIRDQMVALGGMVAVAGAHNQLRLPCGHLHVRAVKFLLAQATGKAPDYSPPTGEIKIRDTKTRLELMAVGRGTDRGWVYEIGAQGEAPNVSLRLKMVVKGFVRYGDLEQVSETEVAFPCGQRHDELVRLVLPYSRNISGVESQLEADALRGQMTTSTLGFNQT